MQRAKLIDRITDRLGKRHLVWAGIRGDDIEPLADIPQLHASFSIIGRYSNRATIESLAYEDLTGRRVDLETWDIDRHLHDEATQIFRRALLQALAEPSAMLPYRASRFLSAICFARRDRTLNLGLFGAQQSAFEHKPWVETSIAALGVDHLDWRYVADEEQLRATELLADGPVMLRRSRTSGGEGFTLVHDADELAAHWPRGDEGFVSVSRYVPDTIPVNVGAVVWEDGVSVHHPSTQLIGIPGCTNRPFGYCGNDFNAIAGLGKPLLARIEAATRDIGDWLHRFGYRGAFGVDYLVVRDRLMFIEINPRFQGSTRPSCQLDIEQDRTCLMLEHVAAVLGLPAPEPVSLAELVEASVPLSNVVVHSTASQPAVLDASGLVAAMVEAGPGTRASTVADQSLLIEPGATVARFTIRDSVTPSGFELHEPWASIVRGWHLTVSDAVGRDEEINAAI